MLSYCFNKCFADKFDLELFMHAIKNFFSFGKWAVWVYSLKTDGGMKCLTAIFFICQTYETVFFKMWRAPRSLKH